MDLTGDAGEDSVDAEVREVEVGVGAHEHLDREDGGGAADDLESDGLLGNAFGEAGVDDEDDGGADEEEEHRED
jgi:hypothetical protein